MTNSLINAETVLALDIGTLNTRAIFFDIVDGKYSIIATATVPSTVEEPYHDTREAIHRVIQKLAEITGRPFFDQDEKLIIPSVQDGRGIDQLTITNSAGPAIKILTIGLLEEVSLKSAKRLANSTYADLVDQIGLNDSRKVDMQIDAIINTKPDLIILAGGTDQGASRSVAKLIDLLGIALKITPKQERPEIIFAGNQAIAKRIGEILGQYTSVRTTPNIRPAVDIEELNPARNTLEQSISRIRLRQINGLPEISSQSVTQPASASYGFGTMIQLLSQINDPKKAVLGINLGSRYTTTAIAKNGQLDLRVNHYGLGQGMQLLLDKTDLNDFVQWLPIHIPKDVVKDYLYQKTLYHNNVPATPETYEIERAAIRLILRQSLIDQSENSDDPNPIFEHVIASARIFSSVSKISHTLSLLLDAIQPIGITTFILDTHELLPSLGSIAVTNPILPVQVIESNAMLNLGTVISPVCHARYGTAIMNVRIEYPDQSQIKIQIKQGTLNTLPIRNGQTAQIFIDPLKKMSIDPLYPEVTGFKVVGGACGVVIDARGRPLLLPADDSRRRDMLKKWYLNLGL